jgi:transposase-like protein
MSGTPKRQFAHEYRAEAVKQVTENGTKASAAAQKLGRSMQTYANWRVRAREGESAIVEARRMQPVSDLQVEGSRLKRALAIAREERDVLRSYDGLREAVQTKYAFIQERLTGPITRNGSASSAAC